MLLANPGRLVAALLHSLYKKILPEVEVRWLIIVQAVHMSVLPRQQDGTTGSANGTGNIGPVQYRAFPGDAIDARRFHQCASIGANCLKGMIVGYNNHNIRFVAFLTLRPQDG